MCKCTPAIRTPWCGKPGCELPEQPKLVMPCANVVPIFHDAIKNNINEINKIINLYNGDEFLQARIHLQAAYELIKKGLSANDG